MESAATMRCASAARAAAAIQDGARTSLDEVETSLSRIAQREPEVQAWVTLDPDGARDTARQRDAMPQAARGPLHGVPFGVKDIIDALPFPTGFGLAALAGHRPARTATVVQRLEDAGAVLLGKLVTTGFAYLDPGPTRHPLDPRCTPGGSSSGSGAAVADGMVPFALATQAAGSTIRPAAFCGVHGFKPTHGRYPIDGTLSLYPSLDTIGLIAAAAEDLVLLDDILARDIDQAEPAPTGPPRIGIYRPPEWAEAEPATIRAMEETAQLLRAVGATLVDVPVPAIAARLVAASEVVLAAEAAASFATDPFLLSLDHGAIGPRLAALVQRGKPLLRTEYRGALTVRDEGQQAFGPILADVDAILTPATPGEAPEGLESTGRAVFIRGWTLMGMPCLALPIGKGPRGLPIGLQLVGGQHRDRELLRIGVWASAVLNEALELTRFRGYPEA
jgi:Asp-tRNA(Asn)/Glu-tRNA(Gln) amidotransferase A subunit family amidase